MGLLEDITIFLLSVEAFIFYGVVLISIVVYLTGRYKRKNEKTYNYPQDDEIPEDLK